MLDCVSLQDTETELKSFLLFCALSSILLLFSKDTVSQRWPRILRKLDIDCKILHILSDLCMQAVAVKPKSCIKIN